MLTFILCFWPLHGSGADDSDSTVPVWWANYRVDSRAAGKLSGAAAWRNADEAAAIDGAVRRARSDIAAWMFRRIRDIASTYLQAFDQGTYSLTDVESFADDLADEYANTADLSKGRVFLRSDGKAEAYVLLELEAESVPRSIADRIVETFNSRGDLLPNQFQDLEDMASRYLFDQDDSPEQDTSVSEDEDSPEAEVFVAFDTPPEAVHMVPAVYPEEARLAEAEGIVNLLVTIGTTGRVTNAQVQASDTIDSLEKAAIEAAEKWLFRPAKQRDKPVKIRIIIPFRFSLSEAAPFENPGVTGSDFERGQGLLQAAAQAHGAGNLSQVKDMVLSESGDFSIQGMKLQVSIHTERVLPDCEKVEQKLPMGTVVMATCGDVAWIDQMQGPGEMPAEARADIRKGQVRDYVALLTGYSKLVLQALPDQEEVAGTSCDVVFVQSDLVKGWKIYIDATSHQLVQMEYKDRSMMSGAPVLAREVFSDYRTIDGVVWPHAREIYNDGELLATVTVTEIKFNTGLDVSAFEMPVD